MMAKASYGLSEGRFTYRIPEDYHKWRKAEDTRKIRRFLLSWGGLASLFVFVVVTVLSFYLRGAGRGKGLPSAVAGAIAAAVVLFIFVYCFGASTPGPDVTIDASRIRHGVRRVPWGKVAWYQVVGVAEFPELRALEYGWSAGGKEIVDLLPFDPNAVDERRLLTFLQGIQPNKHWQH